MAKTPAKRPQGRPRIDAVPVNVRFPPRELKALDTWIRDKTGSILTRAQAVRQIVGKVTGGTKRDRPRDDGTAVAIGGEPGA